MEMTRILSMPSTSSKAISSDNNAIESAIINNKGSRIRGCKGSSVYIPVTLLAL